MKIVVMTDLEGASGIASFEDQTYSSGKYYEQAKKLLTGEVNACVEGMLRGGAAEVTVIDGHGSGGLNFSELHPAARLVHGCGLHELLNCGEKRRLFFSGFDAAAVAGQHSMAGTPDGVLCHTQSSRTIEHYKLNGRPIGEIAQWFLFCGALGLPVIFLSGDEAACREALELAPSISTAAVKRGISRTYAVSLSHVEACRLIRETARESVRRHIAAPAAPVKWEGPFVLEKRFFSAESMAGCLANPLCKAEDSRTCSLKSDDILAIIYA